MFIMPRKPPPPLSDEQKDALRKMSKLDLINVRLEEPENDIEILRFYIVNYETIKKIINECQFSYSMSTCPTPNLYNIKLKIRNNNGKEALKILTKTEMKQMELTTKQIELLEELMKYKKQSPTATTNPYLSVCNVFIYSVFKPPLRLLGDLAHEFEIDIFHHSDSIKLIKFQSKEELIRDVLTRITKIDMSNFTISPDHSSFEIFISADDKPIAAYKASPNRLVAYLSNGHVKFGMVVKENETQAWIDTQDDIITRAITNTILITPEDVKCIHRTIEIKEKIQDVN